MKQIASDYLSEDITDAVITVPAYFTDGQRQATIDAGKIAGLNVLRIIDEPIAAAIAYGVDKRFKGQKKILVFDLGGRAFDVSIVEMKHGHFNIVATTGDTHLGGQDFDANMVEHVCKIIEQTHKKDIRKNHVSMAKVRDACKQAKQVLTTNIKAKFPLNDLPGVPRTSVEFTREEI